MTVKRIGSINPSLISDRCELLKSFPFKERWTVPDSFGLEGVVDSEDIESTDSRGFAELKRVLSEVGLTLRKCRNYDSLGFIRVQGSARFHDDQGLGHIACCLIHHSDVFRYSDKSYRARLYPDNMPQLATLNDFLDIDIGDVFVFNANKYHAWINNGVSVLAQITVKRQGMTM
jgi:hypothetical protein